MPSPALCSRCRLALRHAARRGPLVPPRAASLSTTPSPSSASSIHDMLSRPSWSIRSLHAPEPASPGSSAPEPASPEPPSPEPPSPEPQPVTASQLHHLLRLAALPPPKSAAEEEAMLATLHSQLRFVRAVQRVDTRGVEPLCAIRDETDDGRRDATVSLADLRPVLDREVRVGYYRRPRRVRDGRPESDADKWDPLSTASRKAGKYFIVESGGSETAAP